MTFESCKNHLRDIESVLEFFKVNYKGVDTSPVDIKDDLERERELLEEIEDLKNKLIGRHEKEIPVIKQIHHSFIDRELKTLEESHSREIELLKSRHEEEIKEYKVKIQEIMTTLKDYKKEIMDLKGGIRVFCRIKPIENGDPSDLLVNETSIRLRKDNKDNLFNFDRVFDSSTSQIDVYREVEGFIESIFEGYKVCLFAYGQTGSGKTYTILGDAGSPGILDRGIESIRRVCGEYVRDGWATTMKISCVEFYNEEIYDLLGDQKTKVSILHIEGTTSLQNCTEIEVKEEDLKCVVNQSITKRRLGSTCSNSQSSRSHTVFILKMQVERRGEVRNGSLCLIDLAGSERLEKSKSEGKRLKETQNINRSLSCLGDVFMAILNKDSYIPFRNSKLTHFLQDYLMGDCRVSIILNVSQAEEHYHETLCTLRFGSKVSECKLGKVSKNVFKKG